MGGLIFLVVIIVIVLWVLASCVRIVPQAYAMVVERLGAYKETWNTGLFVAFSFTVTVIVFSVIAPFLSTTRKVT